MPILAALAGLALLAVVLWDGFEAIVLPRRVTRKIRLTRMFFRYTWKVWSALARHMAPGKRRQAYLSIYGPSSTLFLLLVWAAGLILGFALLYWSLGSSLSAHESVTFATDLYMSGTTFFTLGMGDVTPATPLARVITVIEAGTGFGFLALVIGYLPVLYGAFSRREVVISLLDARAGSPATAGELLRRHAHGGGMQTLDPLLHEWERWSAELLESHISYPVLAYFRSQHDNQSWLAALTAILDTCVLILSGVEGVSPWQAQLTFAMARHALVDLAQVLGAPPEGPHPDRLPPEECARLETVLSKAGVRFRDDAEAESRLLELRAMYEPNVEALAARLMLTLPPWMHVAGSVDNWRTSAWGRLSTRTAVLPIADPGDEEHRA